MPMRREASPLLASLRQPRRPALSDRPAHRADLSTPRSVSLSNQIRTHPRRNMRQPATLCCRLATLPRRLPLAVSCLSLACARGVPVCRVEVSRRRPSPDPLALVLPLPPPCSATYTTGRYMHNTKVTSEISGYVFQPPGDRLASRSNKPPCSPDPADNACGGVAFHEGPEQRNMAALAQELQPRVRTFFNGKYLNNFPSNAQKPGGACYSPPGWDRFWGLVGNSKYYDYDGERSRVASSQGRGPAAPGRLPPWHAPPPQCASATPPSTAGAARRAPATGCTTGATTRRTTTRTFSPTTPSTGSSPSPRTRPPTPSSPWCTHRRPTCPTCARRSTAACSTTPRPRAWRPGTRPLPWTSTGSCGRCSP